MGSQFSRSYYVGYWLLEYCVLEKLPSIEDHGHTDRVTKHTLDCLPLARPRHAARIAALARS